MTNQPGRAPADVVERDPRVVAALRRPLSTGFGLGIGVLLVVGLAVTIGALAGVLMSIALALFLALALDPAIRAMQRRRVPRPLGIVIVLAVFLGIVAVVVFVVMPPIVQQAVAFVVGLPKMVASIEASDWFVQLGQTLGVDLAAGLRSALDDLISVSSFVTVSGGVLKVAAGVFGAAGTTLLVIALTLYFVASLETMKRAIVDLLPAYRRPGAAAITDEVTDSIGEVIAGTIAMSAVNAGVILVLQLAIGSPVALLMAVVGFIVTSLPLVGSVIFWVIGTIASFFVSPTAGIVFLLAYLAYMQVESYVVAPRLIGKRAAVPGALVIIGTMAGAALAGLLGALVALPLTASILIIIRKVWMPRQDAKLVPEP